MSGQTHARLSQPGLSASQTRHLAASMLVPTVLATELGRMALGLDAFYGWRVLALLLVILWLMVRGLRAQHPFPRIGSANVVTAARACAVALLAGVATAPVPPVPALPLLVLTTVVALADLADGWLARRTGLASRFGARFDMEVDALFILVLAVLVWRTTPVGVWVLTAGLLRYAFIAAGWRWPWMARALPPSRRRQTLCVVQVVSLIVPLTPGLPETVGVPVAAAGVALLWVSFAIDTRWLARARLARTV